MVCTELLLPLSFACDGVLFRCVAVYAFHPKLISQCLPMVSKSRGSQCAVQLCLMVFESVAQPPLYNSLVYCGSQSFAHRDLQV